MNIGNVGSAGNAWATQMQRGGPPPGARMQAGMQAGQGAQGAQSMEELFAQIDSAWPSTSCTMNRVGKIVPPKRQILKDISLSFFPGAKIGVLGLNGSGKSTLLKIMAGSTRTSRARPCRCPA
jgi:ABC-type transport system involved in cytochrome bd biosynthesis fused ATPase/permease subunit